MCGASLGLGGGASAPRRGGGGIVVNDVAVSASVPRLCGEPTSRRVVGQRKDVSKK